ncbi:hypothetical protein C8R46DRAFT_1087790 [Mycena filopes]|nr:hypothetical protein C8R46DRAFT_1087790 [Mycena filopes]
MSDLDTKQLENAQAFLKHLNALEWDPLADLIAPSFQHQYFPGTIVPPDGKETRGKEEFLGVLQHHLIHVFDKVTYGPPLDVVHGSNKVAFHLKSDGTSKSGKKYNNEYMVTFHFEGEKMIKLNEFVDSKYSSAFFASLRAESA